MYYLQNQFTNIPIYRNLFIYLRMRTKIINFIRQNIKLYKFDKHLHLSIELNHDYYMLAQIMNVISTAYDNGFLIFIILLNKKRDCDTFKEYITNNLYEIYLNDASATARYYSNNLVKPAILILEKKNKVIKKWVYFFSKFNIGNNPFFIINVMEKTSAQKGFYQLNLADCSTIATAGIILTVTLPHTSTHHTPPLSDFCSTSFHKLSFTS